jgi:prephenate dehydrogenase
VRLQDCQITIVGLGLMGGSLAMALRERVRPHRGVWGVARRPRTMHQALVHNVVDFATLALAEGVREADLVILATPVRTIIEMVGQAGPLLKPGGVLLDLGSTKTDIVEAMARLPAHVQPVGGHPMCGKEVAGLDAAETTLYDGAVFVLTPLERTADEALELARQLATAVGAKPLVMEAKRHDRLVATISHLPYTLAVALMGVAEEIGQGDEFVWELAASGFRDTSRLAVSELTMMMDILLTNRQAVAEVLRQTQGQIEALIAHLEAGDETALRQVLSAAQARRKTLFRRGVEL